MEIVTTSNLTKNYHGFLALNNVNVHVEKGDIYGLIGRNGAGKTTLMRIITGLAFPSSGTFTMFGEDGAKPFSRAKLGAIIEEPVLYNSFTAEDNLKTIAVLRGIDPKSSKIHEMLEFAGLGEFAKRKVKNFSLGMRQRLAIAMVMLHSPELLILDEPVNGLDPAGIVQTREMLKKLNSETGVTIIISSHLLGELAQLASKFGIIEKGELVQEITAKDLEDKMAKTLEIAVGNVADAEKAQLLIREKFDLDVQKSGVHLFIKKQDVQTISAEINSQLAKAGIPVTSIQIRSMDLEQYFMQVTSGGAV
jgi:ABC-2 type transport system ATP-binding protein